MVSYFAVYSRVNCGKSGPNSAIFVVFFLFYNHFQLLLSFVHFNIEFKYFHTGSKNIEEMDEKIDLNGHVQNYPLQQSHALGMKPKDNKTRNNYSKDPTQIRLSRIWLRLILCISPNSLCQEFNNYMTMHQLITFTDPNYNPI